MPSITSSATSVGAWPGSNIGTSCCSTSPDATDLPSASQPSTMPLNEQRGAGGLISFRKPSCSVMLKSSDGEQRLVLPSRPCVMVPTASPTAPSAASLKPCFSGLLSQQIAWPGQSEVSATAALYASCDAK